MTAFHTAATPERILELETEIEKSMEGIANLRDDLDKCRNAALSEVQGLAGNGEFWTDGRCTWSAFLPEKFDEAIEALKTKEPI